MKAIERIEKRWFRDEALQALDVEQARGVIDALSLMMFADLETDSDEASAYDAVAMTLPFGWSEIAELSGHAETAAAQAAGLKSTDAVLVQVDQIAKDISTSVRPQVFSMVVAIAVSDRELKDSEAAVLTRFAEGFGFSAEEGQRIYQDTLDAMGLE